MRMMRVTCEDCGATFFDITRDHYRVMMRKLTNGKTRPWRCHDCRVRAGGSVIGQIVEEAIEEAIEQGTGIGEGSLY